MTENLGRELRRISREIDSIAESIVDTTIRTQNNDELPLDPRMVRSIIRARQRRSDLFGALFGEPAWDMMLDLMAAELEGKRVSISSLCIASGVPATTALRWIGVLVANGVLVRTRDAADQRRIYVTLSSETEGKLRSYLTETK